MLNKIKKSLFIGGVCFIGCSVLGIILFPLVSDTKTAVLQTFSVALVCSILNFVLYLFFE